MKMEITVKQTDGIFVTGMRGSGKTYASLQIAKNFKNVIYLDPAGVYHYQYHLHSYIVNPADKLKIKSILNYAFANHKFVVIDEADLFKFSKYEELYKLVMISRNWGCGYLAITRAPANLDKGFINNATWSFIFATYEKNAKEYLYETYTFDDINDLNLLKVEDHTFFLAHYEEIIKDEKGKPKLFRF